jgi:hypothetical protein
MSLRDELLGIPASTSPGYRILIPAGWEEYRPTEETERDFIKRADAPLRSQNRPDLSGQFRSMLRNAFASMRRNEVEVFYLKLPEREDEIPLPLSITVSRRVAASGTTLDTEVAALIRSQGAQGLNEDKTVLRWVSESTQSMGMEKVGTTTISYITPVPGTGRRQALHFAAVIPHPIGMEQEGTLLGEYIYMADVIMSTFAWEPQA